MSAGCCRAGLEAYPHPCPWGHDDPDQERLRLDDGLTQVHAATSGSKSEQSLDGLDPRRERNESLDFMKGVMYGLVIGVCIYTALGVWIYKVFFE